jgi:hypothetical protein
VKSKSRSSSRPSSPAVLAVPRRRLQPLCSMTHHGGRALCRLGSPGQWGAERSAGLGLAPPPPPLVDPACCWKDSTGAGSKSTLPLSRQKQQQVTHLLDAPVNLLDAASCPSPGRRLHLPASASVYPSAACASANPSAARASANASAARMSTNPSAAPASSPFTGAAQLRASAIHQSSARLSQHLRPDDQLPASSSIASQQRSNHLP